MHQFRLLFALIAFGLFTSNCSLNSQIIYGQRNGQFAIFNMDDCSYCTLFPLPACSSPDVLVLPDGRVVWTCDFTGIVYDAQGNVLGSFGIGSDIHSVELHNGLLYLGADDGLYSVNLTNYAVTYIGGWAPGMHSLHGLYSLNGNLYSLNLSNSGPRSIWEVNITNPASSVFVQNMPPGAFQARGVSSANGLVYYSTAVVTGIYAIWSYNQATNTITQLCTYGASGAFWGVSAWPVATAPITCPCATAAGAIPSPAINICGTGPASVAATVGFFLQSNDILRYFLITDPLNITGSIIATATSPVFTFNPASMTQNTTYYVVAGAGDNLNGSINFADPCLSFSNAIPVTWRTLPTVSMSANSSTTVCGGACAEINLNFTGAPPFSLTYTTPFSGIQTQTFGSASAILEICPPPGTPEGSIVVEAEQVSDLYCTCQ